MSVVKSAHKRQPTLGLGSECLGRGQDKGAPGCVNALSALCGSVLRLRVPGLRVGQNVPTANAHLQAALVARLRVGRAVGRVDCRVEPLAVPAHLQAPHKALRPYNQTLILIVSSWQFFASHVYINAMRGSAPCLC